MNQHIASNPSVVRHGVSRPCHREQPGRGIVGTLRNALTSLRCWYAEIDERIARERETREAIEHLEAMSDAQLRDVGISRGDIVDAVRFGRHFYLERDSE